MTDRESQDYGKRAYEHYRKALGEVYPELEKILPPKYDGLRSSEQKVWDKVGAWVAEQVYEGVEQERMDMDLA